ncbi:MAG: hypothetical protein FWG36_08555 [Oscillospiraceae bacterium]|nr:hypothetical protein [Oscillospiraceae bacterium]
MKQREFTAHFWREFHAITLDNLKVLCYNTFQINARVVELADSLDSGSSQPLIT